MNTSEELRINHPNRMLHKFLHRCLTVYDPTLSVFAHSLELLIDTGCVHLILMISPCVSPVTLVERARASGYKVRTLSIHTHYHRATSIESIFLIIDIQYFYNIYIIELECFHNTDSIHIQ